MPRHHAPGKRSLKRPPRRSAQAGFSLIEIIIVTVLIGGIVAFAAYKILGGRDRANYNLAESQVQILAQSIQTYEWETGRLPNSLEDLVRQPGNVEDWRGPYTKESALKDPWGTPYEYRVPGDNQAFELISLGADRQAGGDSLDGDIRYE